MFQQESRRFISQNGLLYSYGRHGISKFSIMQVPNISIYAFGVVNDFHILQMRFMLLDKSKMTWIVFNIVVTIFR